MFKKVSLLGVCALAIGLFVFGGCASKPAVTMDTLAGTWMLAPNQPPSKVTIASMTLSPDGKFNALANYGTRSQQMSGTYTCADGELVFDSKGMKREYGISQNNDELTVTHEGTSVKMVRK